MLELQAQDDRAELDADAVIIGGGLAGIAAAIHLVRDGLRVICIEPRVDVQHIVGESLDWSAPDLLADLGLSMEELVASGGCDLQAKCRSHTTRWFAARIYSGPMVGGRATPCGGAHLAP